MLVSFIMSKCLSGQDLSQQILTPKNMYIKTTQIQNKTRRASLVSNSFSYYKTEGLRVKDEGSRLEVKDEKDEG